jgi:hypothetical protein
VKVGSCSQATSNLANYKVSVGDKIKLSAQSSRIGVVELYQAAFESSISNTS